MQSEDNSEDEEEDDLNDRAEMSNLMLDCGGNNSSQK